MPEGTYSFFSFNVVEFIGTLKRVINILKCEPKTSHSPVYGDKKKKYFPTLNNAKWKSHINNLCKSENFKTIRDNMVNITFLVFSLQTWVWVDCWKRPWWKANCPILRFNSTLRFFSFSRNRKALL